MQILEIITCTAPIYTKDLTYGKPRGCWRILEITLTHPAYII